MEKLGGFEFWQRALKGARFVVAPMVDQSDLAWRMLSRLHGAQLCYSPMLHSRLFLENRTYREKNFSTCPEDRPLIVQFCGNDATTVLHAAELVQDYCDGIDLNLGCPQGIAKRGHYGAFLQDEWDLISEIVSTLHKKLKIPVTCKIRVFPEVEKTIRYAKMLEESGCQLLTIHGRTREQRGQNTGLADWEQIRMVKAAVSIPVFANGNILKNEDVFKCLAATKADGVMVAEGNLYNPGIFEKGLPLTCEMAREYLELCKKYPSSLSFIRGHLFKIFWLALERNSDHRAKLGAAKTLEECYCVFEALVRMLQREREQDASDVRPPHWFCQSYARSMAMPSPVKEIKILLQRYVDRDNVCIRKQPGIQ